MSVSKIVAAAASGVGGAGLDVDEVFSTHLHTGTNSAQTITNNIDLSGEGGLVWLKNRVDSGGYAHTLYDTARGVNSGTLFTDTTNAASDYPSEIASFNNNGFTTVNSGFTFNNANGSDYVSWTFRKAKKFFDVVTWSGNGVNGRTISHNLGSVPGMILVKRTDSADGWITYHRGMDASSPEDYAMFLNLTNGRATETYWNNTAPTSTGFTVSSNVKLNGSSGTYVAYVFAHNDSGDGGFGPDSDQDIIKCGSYAGNGTDARTIDLGFEAQWVLVKRSDGATDWWILDNMRGLHARQLSSNYLEANTSNAEASQGNFFADSQGFMVDAGDYNSSGENYIYMAIRRGPLNEPDDATKVFAMSTRGATTPPPAWVSGFPVDFALETIVNGAGGFVTSSRLTSGYFLNTSSTGTETDYVHYTFDYNNGWSSMTGTNSNNQSWMWKRAPSYFDAVAYSGTGSARTVSHNLGVAPEMMWVKRRNHSVAWYVYHKNLDASNPSHKYIELNTTSSVNDWNGAWNDTAPTASVFTVGTASATNNSSGTYIAYLFASVDGVSKLGSYTGNGGTQNIDCGFSSGARFVLIKKINSAANWILFDSVRGIVSGNDPYLFLNTTAAEGTGYDLLDPYASGFNIASSDATINASGDSYIFYAIA